MIYEIFIGLQVSLFLWMILHDWISVKPFNDLDTLKKYDSNFGIFFQSFVNGLMVFIPLLLTILQYRAGEAYIKMARIICIFYLITTVGTILSWWVPYIFGSPKSHKEEFLKFKNYHTFLPVRGNNVVPNTLHVLLHLQVWLCFGISLYLLL